jgi:hypothetical protein
MKLKLHHLNRCSKDVAGMEEFRRIGIAACRRGGRDQ